jgi:bifunctional non-homologous end joining protein LigD
MKGTVEITRPDKLLYPKSGYTKADLAEYYEQLAGVMLPHLAGRPVVLHRFPDGADDSGFYQKQAPDHIPDPTETVTVASGNRRGSVRHLVVGDVDTLRFLANLACLELHRWLSHADRLDNPDLLIMDLDPPHDRDLSRLRWAVRCTAALFEEVGLQPYLMATGGTGYHVVAPLDRSCGFDSVRALARDMADRLATAAPDRLTTEQRIAKRGDRIFLDTNRNAYAQTAITPYSPRANDRATVATPIEFDELSKVEPDRFDLSGVRRRLARKADPWAGLHGQPTAASAAQHRLAELND